MKVKCNVCGESQIMELSKPLGAYEEIHCPVCDKLMARSYRNFYKLDEYYWAVIDKTYNSELGYIPVEIIEE